MPLVGAGVSGGGVQIPIEAIDNATATINKVDSSLSGLDKTTSSAGQAQGGMAVNAQALGQALAIVTTIAIAAKKAFEFSREGAELERLATAGDEMAAQFGSNMDTIVAKVKEASHGTVSEMDIIGSANKAMMLGVSADADQLANLMEIAAFRGRAMGLDTTQAFDDIVRGIGRASPMILDNLGIVISADETYTKYAESIGKSKEELTKAEKTQALLNATLESGNAMLDKAGGLTNDNASAFERMDASWSNFINNRKMENVEIGTAFANQAALAIDGWDALGQHIATTNDVQAEAARLAELNGNALSGSRGQLGPYIAMVEKQKQVLAEANAGMYDGAEAVRDMKYSMDELGSSTELTTEQLAEITKVNSGLLSLTQSLQRENDNYADSMEKAKEKQSELGDEVAAAIDKYGENSSKVTELKEKYNEAGDAIADLNAKHQDAMNSIAYGLLVAKLQADGFTDAEYQMAIAAGVSMGQIDQATADMATKMNDAANAALATNDISMFTNALPGIVGAGEAAATTADGISQAGDAAASSVGQMSEGQAKAEELKTGLDSVSTTAQEKMKGVQKSFDSLNTSKAVDQINAVTAALEAIPTDIDVNITQTTTTQGSTGGYASGGLVNAPGNGMQDTMLAGLANGEYVVKSQAVRQPGVLQLLEAINSGKSSGGMGGGLTIQNYGTIVLQSPNAEGAAASLYG